MARRSPASPAQTPLNPRPPAPIFMGVSLLGPVVNWFGESVWLARAAVQNEPARAREILGRHDPRLAQWTPECVHDGLIVAAARGYAEVIDLLGPLADIEDAPAMRRILVAASHCADEAILEKVLLHCFYPRWARAPLSAA